MTSTARMGEPEIILAHREIQAVCSPEVYIADTGTTLGRGVFAARYFSVGEIVEIAPVVLVEDNFKDLPLSVQRLVFNWSKLCDSEVPFAVALGFGSLYNHADDPNLRYSADPENQAMIYTAVREIKTGEQLTVNYNQTPEGAEPRKRSWFEIHQVEKIEIESKSNGKNNQDTMEEK